MSHFGVLVVGGDPKKQLAPFHEFECTGLDDEYVQSIDQTADARREYESHKETRYQDPEGKLHDPWQDHFYRDFSAEERIKHGNPMGTGSGDGISWSSQEWKDGRGYRAKVHFVPEGWTEVTVPTSSVESFATFVEGWYGHKTVNHGAVPDVADEHKYGWVQLDENGQVVQVIDRTNPNKHWDWWQIGGRYNGFYKLKGEAMATAVGVVGAPGLNSMDEDYETPGPDRADQCRKRDIDFPAMEAESMQKAEERYNLFALVTRGCPPHKAWTEVQQAYATGATDADGEPVVNWEPARKEYDAQPAVKALRANKETFWFNPDEFLIGREGYIDRGRRNSGVLYAVVKDGQWYERGSMGWWGMSSNEKNLVDWQNEFYELVQGLPDDTLLTVVDCHI